MHSFIQIVLGLEGPSCTAGAPEYRLEEKRITQLAQDICLREVLLPRKIIDIIHRFIYSGLSRSAALPGGRPLPQLW